MKNLSHKLTIEILSIVLISCLGVIVYSNTFFSSFQLDDFSNIVDNFYISNIHNLQNIWQCCPCRFATFFSIAFNYHFNQLSVFGYHLFNMAVHAGSAILVWWLTLLTLSTPAMKENKITQHARLIALFAGLVFVSHPVQTEAVTYIWQRAASMAALFYLASLNCYIKSRLLQDSTPKPNISGIPLMQKSYYGCSLILAAVAMFTKENTITLPLMILLYEFSFFEAKKGFNWRYIFPFLAAMFIIPLTMLLTKSARFQEIHDVVTGPHAISPLSYLLTQFRVMVTYIRLAFLPLHQNLDYDYPVYKTILELPVLASLGFLVTILYCAKRLFLKYRLVSFSIFWFFLTLLPESSFLPQKDVIFEHRLYLPLVGYSMFLVSSMYYIFGKNNLKMMLKVLVMAIACYSVLTYQRNKIWKDEFTLWNDTVHRSPHKARPYNDRGFVYYKQGNFTQAMSDFNKAIEIDPHYEGAYVNVGDIYVKQGNFTQALADYSKAIEIDPNFAMAYNNRGLLYDKQGDFNRAQSDYNKAIEINSNYLKAYNNRGFSYVRQNNFAQAISDFTKAIEIDPKDSWAYYSRGLSYAQQGNLAQALSDFNTAIEIRPDFVEAYINRGGACFAQGNFTQAISDYTKAIELNPMFAGGFYNRALSYYQLKEYDKAWGDERKAEELGATVSPEFMNELKKASGRAKS